MTTQRNHWHAVQQQCSSNMRSAGRQTEKPEAILNSSKP